MPTKRTIKKKKPVKKRIQKGKGFFNDVIMPRLPELHYISPFWLKRHNFTGPGTKLDKRLDKDKKPLPSSIPINEVDRAAYYHDLAYENMKDLPSRRIADNAMIDDLDAIRRDSKVDFRTRGDAFLVGLAMKAKRFFGLGKKKHTSVVTRKKTTRRPKRKTKK